MLILLSVHSITRWLVILAVLALIIRLILGLFKNLPFDKSATALTGAFGGLMDLQGLLGILFFVLDGLGKTGFPRYRWEHAVAMLLAILVAHLPARWKQQSHAVRTRNTLIAVIASLIIIFLGIGPLGGWVRWWHISGLF